MNGTEFCFMKLDSDTIYNAYLNKLPFNYYISILGGMGGLRPCLFCLFRGGGRIREKPAYIILARSLMGYRVETIYFQTYESSFTMLNIMYHAVILCIPWCNVWTGHL